MSKYSIKYKASSPLTEKEQAAGFPPFTRGYAATAKKTHIIFEKPSDSIEFHCSEKSIEDLFISLTKIELPSKINILFNFSGTLTELAYIPVLRTLLSLFLKKRGKNHTEIQFKFYAKPNTNTLPLHILNTANAVGIDYLVVTDLVLWKRIEKYAAQIPVDPFYGNEAFGIKIDTIFLNMHNKLSAYFS